jgi:hypothetical protein
MENLLGVVENVEEEKILEKGVVFILIFLYRLNLDTP